MGIVASVDEIIEKYIQTLLHDVNKKDEEASLQKETQFLCDYHLLQLLQNMGLVEILKEYEALSEQEKIGFDKGGEIIC